MCFRGVSAVRLVDKCGFELVTCQASIGSHTILMAVESPTVYRVSSTRVMLRSNAVAGDDG